MGFIGCGKCSKYYFYILIVFISQFICDLFTGFNKDFDSNSNININDEKYIEFSAPFQSHKLFQDLLKFLGALLSGICLNYYFHRLETNKNGSLSMEKLEKMKKEYFGEKIPFNYSLFLIGLMLSFSTIFRTFLISLELDAGFWTIEIAFLIFLSNKILKIHFGNHQKVTIFLILVILFTCQLISTYLPRTKHNDCLTVEECQNNYLYDNNARFRNIINNGSNGDASAASRWFRIDASMNGYKNNLPHFIFGYGMGNSTLAIRDGYYDALLNYTNSFTSEVRRLEYSYDDNASYSMYIRLISEYGIIWTLLLLLFIGKLFINSKFKHRLLLLLVTAYLYVQFDSLGFYSLWLCILILYYTSKQFTYPKNKLNNV